VIKCESQRELIEMNAKPKILYIDDEEELLTLASSFFAEEGLPIETCGSFTQALEKIRSKPYDLIISDGKMPIGSGKELLSIIKAEKLNFGKFIYVTGNLDYQTSADKDEFDYVFFKPFNFQDLLDRVKEML
jgi:two-component system alkaline phosphatase synthesis response regulator PhoP